MIFVKYLMKFKLEGRLNRSNIFQHMKVEEPTSQQKKHFS
jgi:hypothetical protein